MAYQVTTLTDEEIAKREKELRANNDSVWDHADAESVFDEWAEEDDWEDTRDEMFCQMG